MALSEEPPLEIEVTREQRERERERDRTKEEVVLALRNRNLSNYLFHLDIFLPFFYLSISLSLASNHDSRDDR